MKYFLPLASILIPIIALVLIVSQVVVSNELATLGKHLGALDDQIAIEQDQRLTLETEVASRSALVALRDRAMSMGFTEPTTKQILNLSGAVPVAFGGQKPSVE